MSLVSPPTALRIEQGARTRQPVIISLDSTEPGPALGGCRIKPYPSWRDGLDDALRLSAAMTAKTALAGMPYGGGKTVVALSPATAALYAGDRRADLLADIGEAVESLGGRPARELTFAIQGLGHVGRLVAEDLARQGASLVVADTDPVRQRLARRWGARLVSPEQLLTSEADILIPAALGGILTRQTVPALRCRAIVGPANNQLADDSVDGLLHAHGITWAPDPVVSAGGVIAAVAREIDHLAEPEVQGLLAAIGDRLGAILDESARSALPPLTVARQRMLIRPAAGSAAADWHSRR